MGKKYKKILKFMLSLTMLLTCIFQLPIQVNALTRTNYALNKPVTESYAYPGMEGDKAVDGDTNTRWATEPRGTNQWIRVDLEEETTFDELVIIPEKGNVQKFKIEVSNDDSIYEMIYDSQTNTSGFGSPITINLDTAITYRYVKLTIDSLTEGSYPSISLREFQIIGDEPENVTAVKEAIEKIDVPEKVYQSFNVPTKDDELGVAFTWQATNNKVEITDGKVTPLEEGKSGITLTASKDGYEMSKTFNFMVYTNEVKDYEIYPIVQNMTYGENVLALSENINIVMDENTSENIKNYAQKILKEYQYTSVLSTVKSDSDVNLIVGVIGDNGLADQYFNQISYDKTISTDIDEGYVLSVSVAQNAIMILGKDYSGMFNGLSTFSQMLLSSRSNLKEVLIEDAPETRFRGFIEGFYGNPWSHANRMDLMDFCGQYKMNTYIYGPKNDPYHTNQWRDPYPDAKLAELKELVDKGKETNVEFVWAIHVGGKIDLGSADDIQKVKDKFDQLYGIGVRQFAVFFDDAATDNTQLVSFMNDLQKNYVETKGDVKPLVFCPQFYNKSHAISRGGEDYLRNLRNFDEDIQIMWTGDYVVSRIDQSVIDYITDLIDRDVYIWWNYPVNDLGRAHLLHMGPTDALAPNIEHMSGLVSNPMNQAQCNKVSLFSIANYTWNSEKYDSQQSWQDSWQRIITDDEEALEAFKIFVQNCAAAPMSFGEVDESVYLQPYFEAFNKKYYANEDFSQEALELINKFKEIKDSIVVLRNYEGTNNITREMSQWMDVMYDIADAGDQTLTALLEAKPVSKDDSQSIEDAMNLIQNGRALLNKSNNGHGGKKCAQKHLYPFIETLLNNEEKKLYEALDFEIPQEMFGSSATDYTKAMDHDITTAVDLGGQAKDSYFGVDLGKVTQISDISIQMKEMNGDKYAYYKKGALEYSIDKITWTKFAEFDTPSVELTDCNINARFIRYRAEEIFEDLATGFNQSDIQLCEMSVNTPAQVEVYTNLESTNATIDKVEKDYTLNAADQTLEKDQYLGIEFRQMKTITDILNKPEGLTLQYSVNGTTWKDVPTTDYYNIYARYIRLINTSDTPITFSSSLKVHCGGEVDITDAKITNGSAYSGSPANMYDNNEGSSYWLRGGSNRDLIITLADSAPVYDIYLYGDKGSDVIQQGTVYISTDNNEWIQIKEFDVGQTTRNTITLDGQMAKYIKIAIKNTGWIKVNEIKVNTSVAENISIVEGEANVGNIIDMKLFTDYNTGSNAGSAIYKTFNLTNENTIKFLKNNNSTLRVEALLDGKWEEIGTYTNMYNEIYFDEEFEQFRFSWDADSNVKFYELAACFTLADYTEVDLAIEKANKLNKDDYVDFTAVEEAINAVVRDLGITHQEEVDAMAKAINDAIDALEKITIDKTALKIAVDLANAITDEDLDKVIPVVANEFKAARDKANEVYNNASASQVEVNNAFDRLASAMQKLEFFKGDKTALKAFIDKVTGLDSNKYTQATWAPFNDALTAANGVYNDLNAMQEEVNEAYTNLVTAFLNLRLIPDKSLLEELINQANELNSANYTKASFDGLTKALNEAKVVYENPNATQKEVDNAKATLEKAIAELQTVTTDSTVNNGDTTSVKTGDDASLIMLMSLAGLSALGLVYSKKKRKNI